MRRYQRQRRGADRRTHRTFEASRDLFQTPQQARLASHGYATHPRWHSSSVSARDDSSDDEVVDYVHDESLDDFDRALLSELRSSTRSHLVSDADRPLPVQEGRLTQPGPYPGTVGRQTTNTTRPASETRSYPPHLHQEAAVMGAPRTSLPSPPTVRGIRLVPTSRLPDQMRSVFPFPIFNVVQSKCFSCAFDTDENLVVSAPTSSGKTAIMELAICRYMAGLREGRIKVVYQAPTKSLCAERYRDWDARFGSLNVRCAQLTGDTDFNNLRNVGKAAIIITTPEKWDSVTRKWKDNARLMGMIKLCLVDEVHILKEARGATLEAIVSRMKSVGSDVRFVALSATIPNSCDIATWLTSGSGLSRRAATLEVFDETFRPVELQRYVESVHEATSPWDLDNRLTKSIYKIVKRYSKRKPVMIFCVSKESAKKTACTLADSWFSAGSADCAWNGPRQRVNVSDENLLKTTAAAVAFHHSGLNSADRQAIEEGFLRGNINVICSTSTLAVGINLPCYLVILKGTSAYTDHGLQEYGGLEVMQMLGRAGRPQFETEARAVILCSKDRQHHYQQMVTTSELLESSLHLNLVEHLNAEIGMGTIHNFESAARWLDSTFLSVRIRRNPRHYIAEEPDSSNNVGDFLRNLCEREVSRLKDDGFVVEDQELRCTEYGDIMARYCVKYDTMKTFLALPSKAKVSDVLSILSAAVEFQDCRLKATEKLFYRDINKSNDIRFPISVNLTSPAHKVSLIVQAKLGSIVFDPSTNNNKNKSAGYRVRDFHFDALHVLNHCKRLIRCIVDVLIHRGDSIAVRSALELGRGLAAGVWEDTPLQLKQIPNIGEVFARKLAAAGINSIDALSMTEPHRIDVILSKSQPFGHNVIKSIATFPVLRVSIREVEKAGRVLGGVRVKLGCNLGFVNEPPTTQFNKVQFNVLFLCETSNGHLIDFRRFHPSKVGTGTEVALEVTLKQSADHVACYLMCDDVAGTVRSARFPLNIPSSWFDAQPGRSTHEPDRVCNGRPAGPDPPNSGAPEIGDQGLDDSDLLQAFEESLSGENIQDIANVQIDQAFVPSVNDNLKRKRSCIPGVVRTPSAKNGVKHYKRGSNPAERQACQHRCKDKTTCMHKCCKDGVAMSKKRSRRTPDEAGDPNELKDKGLTPGISQTRPDDIHVPRAEKPKKSTSSLQEADHVRNSKANEVRVYDLKDYRSPRSTSRVDRPQSLGDFFDSDTTLELSTSPKTVARQNASSSNICTNEDVQASGRHVWSASSAPAVETFSHALSPEATDVADVGTYPSNESDSPKFSWSEESFMSEISDDVFCDALEARSSQVEAMRVTEPACVDRYEGNADEVSRTEDKLKSLKPNLSSSQVRLGVRGSKFITNDRSSLEPRDPHDAPRSRSRSKVCQGGKAVDPTEEASPAVLNHTGQSNSVCASSREVYSLLEESHEADQKKMWADIESDWLTYKNFGDTVDIV